MRSASKFHFRLYIAAQSANSMEAVVNLDAFCRKFLPDRYQIEIVDVIREPKTGLNDNVLLTPTVLKLSPGPVRRIVGNLSNTRAFLDALGLEAARI